MKSRTYGAFSVLLGWFCSTLFLEHCPILSVLKTVGDAALVLALSILRTVGDAKNSTHAWDAN